MTISIKKSVLAALFIACAMCSVHAEVQDDVSETFGAAIEEWPVLTPLAEVLDNPDSYLGNSLAIKTEVSKVCQKKGCFFIAQQGEKTIRVAFKDYAFFVPTDIAGKAVTLVGEIKKHDVTNAQAEHLSNDLGQKGRIKSGVQYQIIASSVKVPKLSKEH